MAWGDLLAAFALYLVIEGVLPFLDPRGWREAIARLGSLSDRALRLMGLGSMAAGLILLLVVRG